jgi:hypothetical protein
MSQERSNLGAAHVQQSLHAEVALLHLPEQFRGESCLHLAQGVLLRPQPQLQRLTDSRSASHKTQSAACHKIGESSKALTYQGV